VFSSKSSNSSSTSTTNFKEIYTISHNSIPQPKFLKVVIEAPQSPIKMSTKTSPEIIALFGGTAGVGLATLHQALKAGHTVNALARTPLKLAQVALQYPDQLHIIKGDIRDIPSLKSVLTINNQIADIIISSIGMVIQRQGLGLASADTKICEEGTRCILSALSELEEGKVVEVPARGLNIVLLSTTRISEKGRDIPLAMVPLYSLLSTPHIDKKNMENLIVNGEGKGRNWILIRPSFLMNGASKGLQYIRVSTETPGAE
jgi:hypothetical protein